MNEFNSSKHHYEISTTEFMHEIKNTDDPANLLSARPMTELNLPDYLKYLLEKKGLVRKDVIKEARLNETYGWEIFSLPQKRPGKDKLVAIALAMGLNLEETRRLFWHAQVSFLYPKTKRGALIIFAIQKEMTLTQADELLFENGCETITEG